MVSLKISVDHSALDAALKKAPEQVSLDVGNAIGVSLREVADLAKRTHKFKNDSGNAEAHILEKTDKSGLNGMVYLEKGGCDYVEYLHTGTKPHKITPKNGKALYFVSNGQSVFSRGVNHPGTRKDEFLYRALRKLSGRINKKISNAVSKAIKKAGLA